MLLLLKFTISHTDRSMENPIKSTHRIVVFNWKLIRFSAIYRTMSLFSITIVVGASVVLIKGDWFFWDSITHFIAVNIVQHDLNFFQNYKEKKLPTMQVHVLISVFMVLLINSAESLPAINQAIRNKIEEIRKQMPCGINNGPVLVPFRHDMLEIDYNRERMTYLFYGFMVFVYI